MISSFENFIDGIKKTVVFRAKNFAVTDCDFASLIEDTYIDILSEVNLSYVTQEVLLEKDVYKYVLPNNLTDANGNFDIYTFTTDIVDENGYDVSLFATNNNHGDYIFDVSFVESRVGETMYIKRIEKKALATLTPDMLILIKPAMVQGLLFYIEDAIPSAIDSQAGNLKAQRFYNSKKTLKEMLPQNDRFDGRQPGSQNKVGVL